MNSHDERPTLAPGYYRLRPAPGRWWAHDELTVLWVDGQWCVTPTVALAALPEGCVFKADGTIRSETEGQQS